MKKKIVLILIPLVIFLGGCQYSENELNKKIEIVNTDTQVLKAIDENLSEEGLLSQITEDSIEIKEENGKIKITNLTENRYKNIKGKVTFLDDKNQLISKMDIEIKTLKEEETIYYTEHLEDVPKTFDKCLIELEGIVLEESIDHIFGA